MPRPTPSRFSPSALARKLFARRSFARSRRRGFVPTAAVESLEARVLLAAATPVVAVGSAAGQDPVVTLYGGGGNEQLSLIAFPTSYRGGVRVAAGDFNGDGVADIAAATAAGPRVIVRVFDGTNGRVIAQVRPFGEYRGGAFISAGDFNGDGTDELIVGADRGGDGDVRIFDLTGNPNGELTARVTMFAGDPAAGRPYTRGVRVATGDVNGDGQLDLIGVMGPGGPTGLRVVDGNTGRTLRGFYVFEDIDAAARFDRFRGGAFVAAGDLDGNGTAELLVTPEAGGPAELRVFNGGADSNLAGPVLIVRTPYINATAGARVAAADVNGDGRLDAVFAPGDRGRSAGGVRVLDILTGVDVTPDGPLSTAFARGASVAAAGPAPTFDFRTDRAPTPRDDYATVAVGQSVAVDVLNNDTDPEGDPLVLLSASATDANPVITPEGLVRYTARTTSPSGSQDRLVPPFVDPVTYVVTDGVRRAEGRFLVFVTPNDPARPYNTAFRVDQRRFRVTAGDGPVFTSVAARETGLQIVPGSDPRFQVERRFGSFGGSDFLRFNTPAAVSSSSTFTATVWSANRVGGIFYVNVTIIVDPVRPVGAADSYSTPVNTRLVVGPANGVLANDVGGRGETSGLTAFLATPPRNGRLLDFRPDGAFVYQPNTGFAGTDTFEYRFRDASGVLSDPITVTITVGGVTPPAPVNVAGAGLRPAL